MKSRFPNPVHLLFIGTNILGLSHKPTVVVKFFLSEEKYQKLALQHTGMSMKGLRDLGGGGGGGGGRAAAGGEDVDGQRINTRETRPDLFCPELYPNPGLPCYCFLDMSEKVQKAQIRYQTPFPWVLFLDWKGPASWDR